jgi:hypothetical protein
MQNHPTVHIKPLTLWQCACGGADLSNRDYEHIMGCPECETLAVAISDALNDIEKAFGCFPDRTSLISPFDTTHALKLHSS